MELNGGEADRSLHLPIATSLSTMRWVQPQHHHRATTVPPARVTVRPPPELTTHACYADPLLRAADRLRLQINRAIASKLQFSLASWPRRDAASL
ncbi:hypothetical protein E2542_SST23188 [Spatholobus suberectus]|nr:hypothetical protein E2542_SST23188 [Spatholobus suberectus]